MRPLFGMRGIVCIDSASKQFSQSVRRKAPFEPSSKDQPGTSTVRSNHENFSVIESNSVIIFHDAADDAEEFGPTPGGSGPGRHSQRHDPRRQEDFLAWRQHIWVDWR